MRRFSLISLIVLLAALVAPAADVKLAWDPNPDSNVVYRVYVGTNSQLATNLAWSVGFVDAGTNLTATVTNLSPGRWFFVATARPLANEHLESEPSNMVDTMLRIGRVMNFRLITVTVP